MLGKHHGDSIKVKAGFHYYEITSNIRISKAHNRILEPVERHSFEFSQVVRHLEEEVNVGRSVREDLIRSKLKIYKLPSMSLRCSVTVPAIGRYYFVEGPDFAADHSEERRLYIEINSKAKAEALLNSMKRTWATWGELLITLGFLPQRLPGANLPPQREQESYFSKMVSLLASKHVILYYQRFPSGGIAQKSGSSDILLSAPTSEHPPVKSSFTAKNEPTPKKQLEPKPKTDFSNRKNIAPKSLEDAAARLQSMQADIKANGYQSKYTDAELMQKAQKGNVADERYHVRILEMPYLERNKKAGALGQPMQTESGKGAKYWSTTFDQLEDCDTDATLICQKVGIDAKPGAEYVVAIIDTDTAKDISGVKSIVPTFAELGNFAKTELPKEFPADITDAVLTPEFQETYAAHHKAAVKEGFLENEWSKDEDAFNDYLAHAGVSGKCKDELRIRFEMQNTLGNNQHYEGNGLTKNLTRNGQSFGVVETFNFERKEVNLDQLVDAKAIRLQKIS